MFPVKHLPEPDTLIKINLLDFDPDLRRRFVQIVRARRLLDYPVIGGGAGQRVRADGAMSSWSISA
jgi:hypothetical protein